MTNAMNDAVESAVDLIRRRAGDDQIEVAFVLGTGLGGAVDALENSVSIPYAEIPGFPETPVLGHEGRLVIGTQEGTRVAYLVGRAHYYERGNARAMAFPLEALALLGLHVVILTCSVGSANADVFPGMLVLVTDHINLSGFNPLIGVAEEGGFLSMTEAYDNRLTRRLKRAAVGSGVQLKEGVYMWVSGPTFETPAEIRMARTLGADVVGMSLVPEVILARRLAMRVAAVAVVTNFGAGFSGGNPTHAQTIEVAHQGAISVKRVIRAFLKTRDEAWGLAGREIMR